MPNTHPGYALFKDSKAWDLSILPAPYNTWEKMSTDQRHFSVLNTQQTKATLVSYIVEALLAYVQQSSSPIGVIRIADGDYVSQWKRDDGTTLIAHATKNGVLEAAIADTGGRFVSVQGLGNSNTVFDTRSIMLLYLFIQADVNASNGTTVRSITTDLLTKLVADFAVNGVLNEDDTRLVCDDLYYSLAYSGNGHLPCNIRNGNITFLVKDRIQNHEFSSGIVVCGDPDILKPKSDAVTGDTFTVGQAKELVKDYVATLQWTEDEEMMIPQYDDDFPVPPEVMKFINRFIGSRNSRLPMVNFCWRGITAYGKSTGVEIMACILHTPLVWMTCSSTTEKTDFLCQYVPSNSGGYRPLIDQKDLPTLSDMVCDPDYAYTQLTGEKKEGATSEEVAELFYKTIEAKYSSTSGAMFKLVESDYIKALTRGWIVEVQEFSRIRDSGVLVGLNQYDRPGSVIPLINGDHLRRHPNAICMWTDNVGYNSCRPVDPSFIRRQAFVIDSYELPKERAYARIKYNTGCTSDKLLDKLYSVWEAIGVYCKENDITEGPVSLTELERWVSIVLMEGEGTLLQTCRECIVAKATSDPDSQQDIMTSCVEVAIAKANAAAA